MGFLAGQKIFTTQMKYFWERYIPTTIYLLGNKDTQNRNVYKKQIDML